MTAGTNTREQRLRKQAELQSLSRDLATLRKQEGEYISTQAVVPAQLMQQIGKIRQQTKRVEDELLLLEEESIDIPAYQFYRKAFAAELDKAYDEALKLYKNAARHSHGDAQAASRSLRYRLKTAKPKTTAWSSISSERPRTRFPWGVIVALLIFVALFSFALSYGVPQFTNEAVVGGTLSLSTRTATATDIPLPPVIIVPSTATLTPTGTRFASVSTDATPVTEATNTLAAEIQPPTAIPLVTATPTPLVVLESAPLVIGPKNGLVWGDGSIVFEFEDMGIREDELYCLDTLRGYDKTLTENWSHPPIGKKQRSIPIEANVFRIAKTQGIQCIAWSAYIGRGTCENVVSQHTDTYIIGLPRACVLEE